MPCKYFVWSGEQCPDSYFISNGLEQERDTAENSYRLLIYTLQMSGETETYSEEDMQVTLRQIAGQRGSYWDLIALSGDDGVLYSQGKAAEYLTRTEERGDEDVCVVTSFRTDDGDTYIRVFRRIFIRRSDDVPGGRARYFIFI